MARLELVFGLRGHRTVLRHAYAEPPLRAGRCFQRGDSVHMILAWSAPGIFGGDRFSQYVHVERGASVRLTSQSALQAHPSPIDSGAAISSTYVLEDEAMLECRWDPLIPFGGARLSQHIDIRLAPAARLFWSDAFMCGRVESGERWAFAELTHDLSVRRGDALEYKERYRIQPAEQRARQPWVAADASYFGTVLSSGREIPAGLVSRLHHRLTDLQSVRAAADQLDSRLLLARLMTSGGAPFREARSVVDRVFAESVLDMDMAGHHSGELSCEPVD